MASWAVRIQLVRRSARRNKILREMRRLVAWRLDRCASASLQMHRAFARQTCLARPRDSSNLIRNPKQLTQDQCAAHAIAAADGPPPCVVATSSHAVSNRLKPSHDVSENIAKAPPGRRTDGAAAAS